MPKPTEDRQIAYQQLIYALLQCPENQEERVLAANPELVDEGLVQELRNTAQTAIDRQDPDLATTIEWLTGFADHLAHQLESQQEHTKLEAEPDRQLAGELVPTEIDPQEHIKQDREIAYQQLIYALLQCPENQEERVLAANPELVDEGLVEALLATAQRERERRDPDLAPTIEWLTVFAEQLAHQLKSEREARQGVRLLQSGDNGMVAVQQDRQVAYQQLIHALLECPENQEERVLSANPELVDEGLIKALVETAETAMERHNPAEVPAIEWLTTFAEQLARKLGFEIETSHAVEVDPERQFAVELLQTVADSQGDGRVVHEFFAEHTADLNEKLLVVFPQLVQELLERERDEDRRADIGAILGNLAVDLNQCPKGDRAIQIELSILCYKLALLVFTRDNAPLDWAMTENNRAIAYRNRIKGDRAVNLEEAIAGYDRALIIYNQQVFPVEWAMTENNRATVYCERVRGDRAANLEEAIAGYDRAALVYTQSDFPAEWAMIQLSCGNAYSDRIEGDRAANLAEALARYDRALLVYNRADFPTEWAMTENNRAHAYREKTKGDREVHLAEAMVGNDYAKISLDLLQAVANSSGDEKLVYQFLDRHITDINKEFLGVFSQLVEVLLDREEESKKKSFIASTLNTLGNRFEEFPRGTHSINLELAIACYDRALSVYTQTDFPIRWAMTQTNRAIAYRHRIEGDPSANLEETIVGYDRALLIITEAEFPIQWATTQTNRAIAYRHRIEGDRSANLEETIAGYERALHVYTQESFPSEWAMTEMNLANAYRDRIEGDRAENLELAIAGYDRALLVRTEASLPIEWATTEYNRANAYVERIEGDRAANLDEAIAGYDRALHVRTQADLPPEWAATEYHRANAYVERIEGDRAENLDEAIAGYDRALLVYTQEHFPMERAMTEMNRANAYKERIQGVEEHSGTEVKESGKIAIEGYQAALEVYNPETFPTETLAANRGLGDVYFQQGSWQLALDAYETAIETCEGEGAASESIEDKLSMYENAFQCAVNLGNYAHAIEITERIRSSQLAPATAVTAIDFATIQKQIPTPQTAILTSYTTANDTHIFIIKQGQEPTLHTCKQRGQQNLQQWLATEWIAPSREDISNWAQQLPRLLHQIADRLQLDTLIHQHLADISSLIIVPHLNLQQIPFNALPIIGTQNLLGDKFTIRTIPICQHPDLALPGNSNVGTSLPTDLLYFGAPPIHSTLWQIDDFVTAIFNLLYHHQRQQGIDRPIALHTAQSQLRNLTGAQVEQLYCPPAIAHVTKHHPDLVPDLKYHLEAYCHSDRPFAAPYYWAAFTAEGMP
jgi:CHAT domain-containing protein